MGLGLSDSRLITADHALLPSKENMFFTVSRSDHISSLTTYEEILSLMYNTRWDDLTNVHNTKQRTPR